MDSITGACFSWIIVKASFNWISSEVILFCKFEIIESLSWIFFCCANCYLNLKWRKSINKSEKKKERKPLLQNLHLVHDLLIQKLEEEFLSYFQLLEKCQSKSFWFLNFLLFVKSIGKKKDFQSTIRTKFLSLKDTNFLCNKIENCPFFIADK